MHVILRKLKIRTISFLFNFCSKNRPRVKSLRYLTFSVWNFWDSSKFESFLHRTQFLFEFWAILKSHAYANMWQILPRCIFEQFQNTLVNIFSLSSIKNWPKVYQNTKSRCSTQLLWKCSSEDFRRWIAMCGHLNKLYLFHDECSHRTYGE